MLVIEGCDCSGKTTLLNQVLSRALKLLSSDRSVGRSSLTVKHFGRLPESFDYYLDYLKEIGPNVITDRFFFSELVYGPVMRDGVNKKFDWTRQRMAAQEMLTAGSLVVRCSVPHDVLRQRLSARGDEYVKNADTACLIADKFKHLSIAFFVGSCYEDVDTSSPVSDDVITRITERWLLKRERAMQYAAIGGGWGSLETENVLVIGERPNVDYEETKYHKRPFSVPNPAGKNSETISSSSEWVMRMLLDAGLNPPDYHITNVYHSHANTTRLDEEIEFLKPNKIIVMGGTAQRAVNDLGISKTASFFLMPHPQYLRRFHQKRYTEFSRHLTNFIKTRFVLPTTVGWSP